MSQVKFSLNELVSFGGYLLSEERKKMFDGHEIKGLSKEERMSNVTDADISNWLDKDILTEDGFRNALIRYGFIKDR